MIAKSGSNKKKDKKMKQLVKKRLLYHTKTKMECEEGIILMSQADELLQRKKKQLLKLKKIVNQNNGQLEERREQSIYRLSSTENKLEVAMRRFNTVHYENQKIRQEIEHMLNDRALFNESWTKMLVALKKGKKFLTDLFESSTVAYDQRDEWVSKLKSVQEKGKLDQMMQMQEMRGLQKAYDHELKLFNFLARKGVMRINKKQEEKEKEQLREEKENIETEIARHVKILNEVTDYAKVEDINAIIEEFERVEQNNFSMYKLFTDICAENDVCRRDLTKIRQDIEDRKDWNENMEEQRQRKLQNLREQLETQKLKTEEARQKNKEKDGLLNRVMDNVHEIFKYLECSLEPYTNLLGDKQPSLHQLDLTFRLISEKIKEYIQITYYYERHLTKKVDKSGSRLKKYTVHPQPANVWTPIPINLLVPADPCPSCVEARWMSRVTETPEVPMNKTMALAALRELATDPAFERSDRVHQLVDCRVPRSRAILARRYMNL
ncbi:putative autophagy-related protein 11 isoform X2 [Leptidea sinapis]|uniref:putative autophagy-related protein 11 isoform X2 n=1 Tax=Leptidea sinapis TaxID=189913 RepID=UPI00212CB589|nr:putative autophagy-related protein 11 isoform X2 [Leptidea sinapis]